MHSDRLLWTTLTRFPLFGPRRFALLQKAFPHPQAIFQAGKTELLLAKLPEKVVDAFLAFRKELNPEKEEALLERSGITILLPEDPTYPKLLRTIYDPPAVLFLRGALSASKARALAVIGSRTPSSYALRTAKRFVDELVRYDITIISGLARGVDALAHASALSAHGTTVAILGCGLDDASLYPAVNRALAHQIIEQGGALISEHLPETRARKEFFPQRNRVIAGWGAATLVIEAGMSSGSLITAQCALEAGRDVFVVPGLIETPSFAGSNRLIQQGAHLTTESSELLLPYGLAAQPTMERSAYTGETPEETALLSFLSLSPVHTDELTAQSTLLPKDVLRTLSMLVLKGALRELPGGYFLKP